MWFIYKIRMLVKQKTKIGLENWGKLNFWTQPSLLTVDVLFKPPKGDVYLCMLSWFNHLVTDSEWVVLQWGFTDI